MMLIKIPRGWELPERAACDESLFHRRRQVIKGLAAGSLLAAAGLPGLATAQTAVARNMRYRVSRALTPERDATSYNNFYEFGSHKGIAPAAQKMTIDPFTIRIDGLVETPREISAEELIAKMPLEERVYRLRCVEAWAMTVPWIGFPMSALIDFARPLSGARYVEMETLSDTKAMPGLRQFWYPWPYIEGLTLAEATNELAFMVTGLYGKPLPKQNGAPIRLAVPWKYGFKSVKSIVRITFTDRRPKTFWEAIAPNEYGFWANVNPEVPHRRWSQASERLLSTGERVPTRLFNGYGEFVADLYQSLQGERLYA